MEFFFISKMMGVSTLVFIHVTHTGRGESLKKDYNESDHRLLVQLPQWSLLWLASAWQVLGIVPNPVKQDAFSTKCHRSYLGVFICAYKTRSVTKQYPFHTQLICLHFHFKKGFFCGFLFLK